MRSSLELEEVGRIKDSINVPMVNATKKWDSEQQKKVVKKEDNPDFVKQVTPHVYPSQVPTQTHMRPTELICHCKCPCDDPNLENVSCLPCIGIAVWNTCSLHLIPVFGVCHAVEDSWHIVMFAVSARLYAKAVILAALYWASLVASSVILGCMYTVDPVVLQMSAACDVTG